MNVEFDRLLPDVEPGSTLYVADEKLRVVYTNDEWRRFAERNEGVDLVGPEKHASRIDNLSGAVQERWAAIYELLLDGSLSHYEEDFICSSPEERRIYRLRVTPTAGAGGRHGCGGLRYASSAAAPAGTGDSTNNTKLDTETGIRFVSGALRQGHNGGDMKTDGGIRGWETGSHGVVRRSRNQRRAR